MHWTLEIGPITQTMTLKLFQSAITENMGIGI